MASILVVDDEVNIIKSFEALFINEHEVFGAYNSAEAMEKIKTCKIDFVFLDYGLPGEDGLEILKKIKLVDPELYVVMISGHGNFEIIIQAISLGAYDYLEKPLDIDKIQLILKRALRSKKINSIIDIITDEQTSHYNLKRIIGNSLPMQNVFKQIGLLVNNSVSVLILGENGTGKELVARALHYSGKYKEEPFIAVNCSGLTESLLDNELFGHEKQAFTGADSMVKGKFEAAGEGTIFLDEIGDMPLGLQSKLLRVLQEKEFQRLGGVKTIKLKARIIAATNRNLSEEVEKGNFRRDLYYRINVAQIELPPLRNRKDDIPALLDYFVKESNIKLNKKIAGASEDVFKYLKAYDWPGNVRELENTITNICINTPGNTIHSNSVPGYIKKNKKNAAKEDFINDFVEMYLDNLKDGETILPHLVEKLEYKFIEKLGEKYNNNKTRISKVLGLSRVTLSKKMNL